MRLYHVAYNGITPDGAQLFGDRSMRMLFISRAEIERVRREIAKEIGAVHVVISFICEVLE